MNRGSFQSILCCELLDLASMRPRFMNRGSTIALSSGAAINVGFNEAPIHESGKYATRDDGRDGQQGFNEAPIHESGKSPRGPCPRT